MFSLWLKQCRFQFSLVNLYANGKEIAQNLVITAPHDLNLSVTDQVSCAVNKKLIGLIPNVSQTALKQDTEFTKMNKYEE